MNNIRQLRTDKKLSQLDLAKLTGLSLNTLSRLENATEEELLGSRVRTLYVVSRALGSKITEVFTLIGEL